MTQTRIERLPLHMLRVDPTVQRGLDNAKVTTMIREFQAEGMGVLYVSDRGPDAKKIRYHVMDGQHRLAAASTALGKNTEVECKIWTGLTRKDEAALFRFFNKQKAAGPLDLFPARLISGDQVAIDIRDGVAEAGWAVGYGNRIEAVGALEALWKMAENGYDQLFTGRNMVAVTVQTLSDAWDGYGTKPFKASLLRATGTFIYLTAPHEVQPTEISLALSRYKEGPERLIRAAKSDTDSVTSLNQALMKKMHTLYNTGRRSRKLPDPAQLAEEASRT